MFRTRMLNIILLNTLQFNLYSQIYYIDLFSIPNHFDS